MSLAEERPLLGRSLPRIPCVINSLNLSALVDTGASSNFIQSGVLANMDLTRLPNPATVFMGCESNVSQSLGQITLPVEIEERRFEIKFTVLSKLQEKVIFGLPFLRKTQATIDVGRGSIYFGQAPRLCLYFEADNAKQRSLRTISPVQLEDSQFSGETKDKILAVKNQFPDVFEETIRQPQTKAVVHKIRVREERPFRQSRYGKMSEARKAIVHEEISKLLEAGVIARSTSPYCW
ncbi:uncharacterized protein [Leptinotarsa decemlineata]|uniref:uncharacterized protein n=1 Tax=Leptinotarsa decemlineata TaxID=7539 RepID=UPI003D30C40F